MLKLPNYLIQEQRKNHTLLVIWVKAVQSHWNGFLMNKLKSFIKKIKNLDSTSTGDLIPYFAFFLIEECNKKEITASNIKECFDNLNIKPYSNISAYISKNSKGKNSIFIKKKMDMY